MSFQNKYLKYKQKYLDLKTQVGGSIVNSGSGGGGGGGGGSRVMNSMTPTLRQLIDFIPLNDKEREIYNIDSKKSILQSYLDDTKLSWSSGKYYLGGQIKLGLDDNITPALIAKAWEAFGDSYACNGAEAASICNAKGGLTSIETIIKKYNEIQKMRILEELNKTKLVSDINNEIVSYI